MQQQQFHSTPPTPSERPIHHRPLQDDDSPFPPELDPPPESPLPEAPDESPLPRPGVH